MVLCGAVWCYVVLCGCAGVFCFRDVCVSARARLSTLCFIDRSAKRKHLEQHASIIGHMRRAGVLSADVTCCVELGAGKAGLAHSLHTVCPTLPMVLVDRANLRAKVRVNCTRVSVFFYVNL